MKHTYTYIIKCPNGKSYYGYRSANKVSPEDDLWKVYFTSSKIIKELREQYGDAEFVASVDNTFKTAEEAHEYETKFLTENDCIKSDGWLNESCFPVFADNTGRKHTEKAKKKMSEGRKGMKLSDKHRKSISESKKGEKNPMFGREITDEHRKKISEAQKGRKLTEKTKKKISESQMGKKHTEAAKKKISEARKGSVPWNKGKTGIFTEAAKKKMGEARKGSVPWNKGKTGVYTEAVIKNMSEAKKKAHLAKKKRNEENVSIEIHG